MANYVYNLTYGEIETTLVISEAILYSILREHLTVKKLSSYWIPHNLSIAQKKARVDWWKEILQKYARVYEPESTQ